MNTLESKSPNFIFKGSTNTLQFVGRLPENNIEAAEISIQKWEMIEWLHENGYHRFSTGGADTCGFCMLYRELGCDCCPVAAASGENVCRNTPFAKYMISRLPEDILHWANEEIIFLEEILAKLEAE